MLKILAPAAWLLSLILMIACSSDVDVAGGGSIDPNASRDVGTVNEPGTSSSLYSSSVEKDNGLDVAESSSETESSSSEIESSSSEIESSSSEGEGANVGDTIYHLDTIANKIPVLGWARNFSAQCIIDYVKVDPDELVPVADEPVAAADVLGPSAYKSVEGDSVNIYLDAAYLNFPCDSAEEAQFFKDINSHIRVRADLVGDTLQMTISRNKSCACAATVSFTLDKSSKDFNYIVFDLWRPIPFQER
jgi:hypothetical protein